MGADWKKEVAERRHGRDKCKEENNKIKEKNNALNLKLSLSMFLNVVAFLSDTALCWILSVRYMYLRIEAISVNKGIMKSRFFNNLIQKSGKNFSYYINSYFTP